MLRYFSRRLIGLIIVLWAMTVVMFVITRLIPGDPVSAQVGFGTPKYVIDSMREQLGLDKPLPEQYWIYFTGLLHGNLGISINARTPVMEDLIRYFPATAELILVSMALSIPMGIVLGVIAAASRGRPLDLGLRVISLLGAAVPIFWLALVFQLIFFRWLEWLPADGRISLNISPPPQVTGLYLVDSLLARDLEAFRDSLSHIILPALAMTANGLGVMLRQTRASMLQELSRDYVRTARAKGLKERAVLYRHTFKNAAIPVVTEAGLRFGIILGGTFLVETVFSWPGLGLYAVRSIINLDYPSIMGVAQLYTFAYVLGNFLVDVSYPLLDPRISY